MAKLKHPHTAPPGGWKYRQPQTGFVASGDSLHKLVANVVAHRIYKGLEPQSENLVRIDVERQICDALGTHDCQPDSFGDPWVPQPERARLTLSDVLNFSAAMLNWIREGRELAPIELAQRRRKVCLECPLNQSFSGCKCAKLYEMVAKIVPPERRFGDLHGCMACGCALQAKVNLPDEILDRAESGREISWPAYCWRRKV